MISLPLYLSSPRFLSLPLYLSSPRVFIFAVLYPCRFLWPPAVFSPPLCLSPAFCFVLSTSRFEDESGLTRRHVCFPTEALRRLRPSTLTSREPSEATLPSAFAVCVRRRPTAVGRSPSRPPSLSPPFPLFPVCYIGRAGRYLFDVLRSALFFSHQIPS